MWLLDLIFEPDWGRNQRGPRVRDAGSGVAGVGDFVSKRAVGSVILWSGGTASGCEFGGCQSVLELR